MGFGTCYSKVADQADGIHAEVGAGKTGAQLSWFSMTARDKLELLFLHALPLDGTMWAEQIDLLPGSTYAPTLYGLGETIEEWAAAALKLAQGDRLIVVGCSVGGSCAIEIAAIAPERVAALVLIGTKARHSPDPVLHASVIDSLEQRGLEDTWKTFWSRLFSDATDSQVVNAAKQIALRQPLEEVANGVNVFHSRPSRDQLLSSLSCPVFVVRGADDTAPGPRTSEAQAASIQHGQLHIIPNCGHYVSMERPEDLKSILRNVIAAQSKVDV